MNTFTPAAPPAPVTPGNGGLDASAVNALCASLPALIEGYAGLIRLKVHQGRGKGVGDPVNPQPENDVFDDALAKADRLTACASELAKAPTASP